MFGGGKYDFLTNVITILLLYITTAYSSNSTSSFPVSSSTQRYPACCSNSTSSSPVSSSTQRDPAYSRNSTSSSPVSSSTQGDPCTVEPEDRQVVKYLQDSIVYIFEVSIYNQTEDPLRTDVSETYKPWKWYRTSSEHGKTLLALSFNYDVLSLNILTIGVEHVYLKLKDTPQGCFKRITAEKRVDILRAKVFDNFKRPKKIQKDENGVNIEDESSVMFVCNEIVRRNKGFGEFANRCCRRDENGDIACSEKEDNVYITVLYVCIGLVKLTMFMFCPLLIPAQMYTAAYLASEYVVNLTQELKMKIFVSESATTSVRYKNRLTLKEITDWKKLRESLEDIPTDEICHVKVPELRIKVEGKRIIPANEPPTGLLRSLYDYLVRCKLRGIEPFNDCCDMSVYGTLEPHIKNKCTWDQVVIQFMKFVTLILIPLPFYIRVIVYYRFEQQELIARKKMLEKFGLEQPFNPFRMNMIQYYSPTHPLFYTTYAFYITSGIVIGFSGKWVREKLKSITRSAFHDMQSVSRTNVLQIVIGILIWPFKKIGLLAFMACPVYTIITFPFWCIIFLLYGVPTFYLGYRLVFHSIKQTGGDIGVSIFESDKPMSSVKQKAFKIKQKMDKIDHSVHINKTIITEEDKHCPCLKGYGRPLAFRRLCLRVTVSLFCLAVLLSSILMFVEAIGIIVEVLVFTMMGIIVNAGSTLRYVSMALLVVVYMHNCYNSVYQNYLEFNGAVLNDIMDRVDHLKKVASLPSSMQENAAFQVKCVEAVHEIPTTLNLEKEIPLCRIGHLLLFLDSFDTPRIPLNLFKKLLMAFGSNQQMSSTNQTLATLAGGFVPMLVKNVLSSKSTKLNLKTLSFKGQVDEIIAEYKQNWPINDFTLKKYDPVAEAEEEAKWQREKENKEKDKDRKCVETNNTGDTDKTSKETLYESEENEKDEETVKMNDGRSLGASTHSLEPPEIFRDSLEDFALEILSNNPRWLQRLSILPTEDNHVDLFIDLSKTVEEPVWNWNDDSSESLQSTTMLNQYELKDRDPRMPYYQPIVIKIDGPQADGYPLLSPQLNGYETGVALFFLLEMFVSQSLFVTVL